MHWIVAVIFIAYMLVLLANGFYFLRKNKNAEDYFVSGRKMTRRHIGFSRAVTDVGGGGLTNLILSIAVKRYLLVRLQTCLAFSLH